MSRTTMQIPCTMSPEEFNNILTGYMTSEGFKKCLVKGEEVWKKGKGILTGPQLLKADYMGNSIQIQGWIKIAWLPFVYSGELKLEGAMGWAIKEMLRARIDNLIKQFNYVSGANYQRFLDSQQRIACDNCGTTLPPNAQFCGNCGKQFANV